MQALLDVILPVFLVIGFGYAAVWAKLFPEGMLDALMKYTQHFAIPCLLFSAIARLDLGQSFDPRLLVTFYTGALTGFAAGLLGARYLFKRAWPDSVAIGFCGLFSNSVLLGLPITERAFGAAVLESNFAIIAVHSPFCYGVGITVMEIVRASGKPAGEIAKSVVKAMFSNALILAIMLGFAVNLLRIQLPVPFTEALSLMVVSALPVALFGLGGVLVSYRIEGDTKTIAYICAVSLVLHPSVTYLIGTAIELPVNALRAAVLTAAMAPGINTYIFASMYGVAMRVAASSVLFATGLSILSVWIWLIILP